MNTPLRFAASLALVFGLTACAQPTNPTVIGVAVSITATERATELPPTGTPVPSATVPAPTDTPTPLPPTPTPTAIPFQWAKVSDLDFLALQFVTSVVIDPTNPDRLFAGTEGAGIYRSNDGGATWQPVADRLRQSVIFSLDYDPANPAILYASTNGDGVYQTGDGGDTWQPVTAGSFLLSGTYAHLAFDPKAPNRRFFTSDMGMYESNDGGASWKFIFDNRTACPNQPYDMVLDPTNPDNLLISQWEDWNGCPSGVYVSTDHGATWNLQLEERYPRHLVVETTAGGKTYFYLNGGRSGPYYSSDGGQSWKSMNTVGISAIGSAADGSVLAVWRDQVFHYSAGRVTGRYANLPADPGTHSIGTSTTTPKTIIIGGYRLYISRDGGNTWQAHEKGLPKRCSQPLFNPFDQEVMYLLDYCPQTWNSALYRSLDRGATWQPVAPNSTGLVSLQFDPDGKTIYGVGMDSVVMASQNRGSSWRTFLPVAPGHNQYLFADPAVPGRLYHTESYGGKGYSTYSEDRGQTWSSEFTHDPLGHGWWQNFPNIYFGQKILYHVNDTDMSFSSNRGGTWQACGDSGAYPLGQTQLIIDPQDDKHLLVAGYGGQMMESVDGCQNWRNAGPFGVPVSSLVQGQPGTVFAATNAGVSVSFNSGKTWAALNSGLPVDARVYFLAADPADPSVIYAMTAQGLYRLEPLH